MQQEKVCSACNSSLPLSSFSKRSGTTDGLQYHCKSCFNKERREYNKNHPEILRGVSERYYEKNRDKVLERAKRIYLRNIEKNKG